MKNQEWTGLPSIDKPWLKFYTEEAINAIVPDVTLYQAIYRNNAKMLDNDAIEYYGKKSRIKNFLKIYKLLQKHFGHTGYGMVML